MTSFISRRRARMIAYCDATPNELHTQSYDEMISNAEANFLLEGDFDKFHDSIWDAVSSYEGQGYLWEYWESKFATAFGYDAWSEMPDRTKEFVQQHRVLKTDDYIRDLIKNWKGNVTATLRKPPHKGREDYIFAPSGDLDGDDTARANYLMKAFGIKFDTVKGYSKPAQLCDQLEVVYGGYDREQLTLIGRVDLVEVYEAGKAPTHVTVGPEDADNLIFYEFHNGCGNMGPFKLTRTRRMPAILRVDGTYGYGVDSCYGFTGEVWRHPIRVT